MAAQPFTQPDAPLLTGDEARGFIRLMAYGRERDQAVAGVRLALQTYRRAQRLARMGWALPGSATTGMARAWARNRIALARTAQAKVDGRAA